MWKQLGYVFEAQKRYADAIGAYRQAGAGEEAQRAADSLQLAQHNAALDQLAREIDLVRQQQDVVDSELGNSTPF